MILNHIKLRTLFLLGILGLHVFSISAGGQIPDGNEKNRQSKNLNDLAAKWKKIEFGPEKFSGTHCKGKVHWDEDNKSIQIRFEEIQLEWKDNGGPSIKREVCHMALPIKLPSGMSISIPHTELTAMGMLKLEKGDQFQVSVEPFFSGQQGPLWRKQWTGPNNENYQISKNFEREKNDSDNKMKWSDCGRDVLLRMNSSLLGRRGNDRKIQKMGDGIIKGSAQINIKIFFEGRALSCKK